MSLSTIVPVAVSVVAPTGPPEVIPIVTVKFSAGSSTTSSAVGTTIVPVVCPAGIVIVTGVVV